MSMTMRKLEWVGVLFALVGAGAIVSLTTGCSDPLESALCFKAGEECGFLLPCCAGLKCQDTPAGSRCTAL